MVRLKERGADVTAAYLARIDAAHARCESLEQDLAELQDKMHKMHVVVHGLVAASASALSNEAAFCLMTTGRPPPTQSPPRRTPRPTD